MLDTPKPPETVGARLARLRKSKGMTQKDLANVVGVSRDLIASYEKGRVRVYDEMVVRFAHLFAITTDQFLGNTAVAAEDTISINPNLLRRMKAIQNLTAFQQKSLLLTIDNFLKGAGIQSEETPIHTVK